MKRVIFITTFITMLGVFSELPTKRSMAEFKGLWENSPFTSKPEKEVSKNELNEWSLAGVSANPQGGYTVTVVSSKDRTDRRRIHSSGKYSESEVSGFKILEVSQGGLNYKETKVKISVDGSEGWISYDEKLLAIKPVTPAQNAQVNQANARPGQKRVNASVTPSPQAQNANRTASNNHQHLQNKQQQSSQQRGAPIPSSRRPRIKRPNQAN